MQFKVVSSLALALVGLMVSIAQADGVSSCQEAKEWADKQTSLPTRLEEISKLHVAYRKEILARSSGAVRAQLWKEHLNSFSAQLTVDQKKYLDSVLALITPSTMTGTDNSVWPSSDEVKKAFNSPVHPNLAQQMFAMLGPWSEEADLAMRAIPKTKSQKGANRSLAAAGGGGGCNCNTIGNYCSGSVACNPPSGPGPYCQDSRGGCGPLWLWPCNGTCAVNK